MFLGAFFLLPFSASCGVVKAKLIIDNLTELLPPLGGWGLCGVFLGGGVGLPGFGCVFSLFLWGLLGCWVAFSRSSPLLVRFLLFFDHFYFFSPFAPSVENERFPFFSSRPLFNLPQMPPCRRLVCISSLLSFSA